MRTEWLDISTPQRNEQLEHVRHDMANLLLPLSIGVETLGQLASSEQIHVLTDMLNGAAGNCLAKLEQLTILLDGVQLKQVPAQRLAAALGISQPQDDTSAWAQADLARLAKARQGMPEIQEVSWTDKSLEITFTGRAAFVQAASAAEPSTPYCVKGIGFDLVVAAHVVGGHKGTVSVKPATGQCRWRLPLEPQPHVR